MSNRCVVLLSGGLDSMLAIRIMQRQGVEVEALNFKTAFTCCQDDSGRAARDLGVRLTVVSQEDDYLDLVRKPRFGYGKGANPCVDCRIYMFEKAKQFMEQVGARFVVSGEVVGQRPMSQKRRDFDIIAHHSGLDDLLLRPLSAKMLPPTLPEREGWVDREQLYDICGRSRKKLIAMAKEFDLPNIPSPSTGCALTEPKFSRKVFDLIELAPTATFWEYDLLSVGRHYRFDKHTKVVVGRKESENIQLQYTHRLPEANSTALLMPDNFAGPTALLLGEPTPQALDYAIALLTRHSNFEETADLEESAAPQIRLSTHDETRTVAACVSEAALAAKTIAAD